MNGPHDGLQRDSTSGPSADRHTQGSPPGPFRSSACSIFESIWPRGSGQYVHASHDPGLGPADADVPGQSDVVAQEEVRFDIPALAIVDGKG